MNVWSRLTGPPDPPGSSAGPPAGPRTTPLRTLLVLAVSAAMLLLGALLLAPASAVGLRPTSVLNVLFDNRLVVGATRLVAAVSLWFLLASMVARATQGQWVRRAGTIDVGDEVAAVSDDQEVLQQRLVSAYDTIEQLRHQLAEAVALLESMSETGEPGRQRSSEDDGGARGQP